MAKPNKMSEEEIQKQIKSLLPHWGARENQRDFVALALGVSRRTVDAWCSEADPRIIPAPQLLRLYIETAIRTASAVEDKYLIDVYDENDDLIVVTDDAFAASFISDMHGGRMAYRKKRQDWLYGDNARLRSRLRQIVVSKRLSTEQICEVLGCDEHGLVTFQIEDIRFKRTPSEHQISSLEIAAYGMLGEAA